MVYFTRQVSNEKKIRKFIKKFKVHFRSTKTLEKAISIINCCGPNYIKITKPLIPIKHTFNNNVVYMALNWYLIEQDQENYFCNKTHLYQCQWTEQLAPIV